jgi:hypothetical protein
MRTCLRMRVALERWKWTFYFILFLNVIDLWANLGSSKLGQKQSEKWLLNRPLKLLISFLKKKWSEVTTQSKCYKKVDRKLWPERLTSMGHIKQPSSLNFYVWEFNHFSSLDFGVGLSFAICSVLVGGVLSVICVWFFLVVSHMSL